MISPRGNTARVVEASSRPTRVRQHSIIVVTVTVAFMVALFNISLAGRCPDGGKSSSSLAVRPPEKTVARAPPSPRRERKPLTGYWWPSAKDGGLIARINALQNPTNCSDAKFLVWRSLVDHKEDTRGLTAWAHVGSAHLFHALTDGDQFAEYGSRILATDDLLWPMAKGCTRGPETRECYFEPLTRCNYLDVVGSGTTEHQLTHNGNEYDRSARVVYLTPKKKWFRLVKKKYSWTKLPGGEAHSEMLMMAAALAYYLRPQQWLKDEIDERIRRSIPADLDPARTVGVPIRRSDKCIGHKIKGSALGELECPPLELYLHGVKSFLEFDPLVENVIVTSEDKAACDTFLRMLKKELPGLRAVRNAGDVQQGTGSGSKLESYVAGSANADVVASALTSMHLHLRARYFVVTTKSTWTSTIAVMARAYGFASEIFVYDIGPNHNMFAAYAKTGGPGGVTARGKG